MSRRSSNKTEPSLSQLTLRGFDPLLERRLREVARERDLSLNRAALLLMRRGAGLSGPSSALPAEVGESLDRFIGLWAADEEAELLAAIKPFEEIDPELWR